MPDIFLSYAREDRRTAERLVQALKHEGLEVWWDLHIHGGDAWDLTIQAQLEQADCVVVLWSRSSLRSEYVNDEASKAKHRGVYLPVLIEKVALPKGFGDIQAENLMGWSGERDHPDFVRLLSALEQKGVNRGEVPLFLEDLVEALHRVPRPIIRAAFNRQGRIVAVGASWILSPGRHPALISICICLLFPSIAFLVGTIKGTAPPLAAWLPVVATAVVIGWMLGLLEQRITHAMERRIWNLARLGLAEEFALHARPMAHSDPNPMIVNWERIEPLLWSSADAAEFKSVDASRIGLLSSDKTAVQLAQIVAAALVVLGGGKPHL